jgi:2-polyprenyl-3-methyl-5-hydroxy-6-metoxy-1,4-benzoquinol methylase
MSVIKDPEHHAADVLHKLVDLQEKRVLEIGCGDGRLTWRYAARALHVTAIDPNAEDIATARDNTPDHLAGCVEFMEASIEDFNLPEGGPKFDVALFGWSL